MPLPFNVDGVDKAKDAVKKDPRLMLNGRVHLPKNDNANYLWIQYFYNYLKPPTAKGGGGRAGFVMASSASDAGHTEKDIREQLVKTGAVDVMMAIGNNFFYTRSLPCTLWFFDRAKENDRKKSNVVLMLDARKIYRKVTSKVNDFSPEQLQNLICIVNLYRGNTQKFHNTVNGYLQTAATLAREAAQATAALQQQLQHTLKTLSGFATQYAKANKEAKAFATAFALEGLPDLYNQQSGLAASLAPAAPAASPVRSALAADPLAAAAAAALLCKALRKPQDNIIKQLLDAISTATKDYQLNKNKDWKALNIQTEHVPSLKKLQQQLSGNPDEEEPGLLHDTEYYYRQAQWLTSRFPEGVYANVEGLCKVVTRAEIEAKDWSLSPGRYVGVDAATDDEVDYEERLNEIHIELQGLHEEAVALAKTIAENFKTVVI